MVPNVRRSYLVLVGVLSAGFAACGSAASPTPSVPTAAPAAVASATPAAVAPATPAPVAAVCTAAPLKFDPKAIDLNGAWAGDDDGIYYVRQRGNVIWWNGMSERNGPPSGLGRDWNNVGRGEIQKDLTIKSDWVDVPRGGIDGYGTVNFKIGPDSAGNIQITKTSETGTGRGDSLWTRCQPGFYTGG